MTSPPARLRFLERRITRDAKVPLSANPSSLILEGWHDAQGERAMTPHAARQQVLNLYFGIPPTSDWFIFDDPGIYKPIWGCWRDGGAS